MTEGQTVDAGPLAGYADWPAYLAGAPALRRGDPRQQALADVLGVREAAASDLRIEREWVTDGVRGRELSWTLGFGPRTRAFVLEPAHHDGDLPGIVALHCHGGVRSSGADQLVDAAVQPRASAARLRSDLYGGRAVANDLARAGFAVLAHDTFSWGSRAFDLSEPTAKLAHTAAALAALWREQGLRPDADEVFDALASAHEETIAKAAGVLGATLAGAVITDDLAALDVLAGWPGVDAGRLGAVGLSGGGGRAWLASALDDRLSAVAVACMMATSASLVPHYLDAHSWLLHSPGLARLADWPAIGAIGSERRVLVQYGSRDELFPQHGMTDADVALRVLLGDRYTGAIHDAGHVWSAAMQDEAREWLRAALDAGAAANPPGHGSVSTARDAAARKPSTRREPVRSAQHDARDAQDVTPPDRAASGNRLPVADPPHRPTLESAP